MKLRRELNRRGSIFQSTSDTEVIIHLVATSTYRTLLDRFIDALQAGRGRLFAGLPDQRGHDRLPRPARHPPAGHGPARRRLHLRLGDGGARRGRRDLHPLGRARRADHRLGRGVQSHRPFAPVRPRPCIFEHVYFSRPDSIVDGSSVYTVRKRIGAELARENPVDADYVVPVPDSGVPAAIGYAQQSGIPFELGIIRSHYVGRTFIQPSDQVRHLGVKLKHNANSALIQGKKLVLIDDSIVRGTTSLKIVQMLRDAGAREVHMRIASPPTRHSCFYGVDTPERAKLLAAQMNVAEMNDYIKRGQPRLSLDRRPLPRARRGSATSAAAALRRLLHRPVSDPPHRP
jgi:amidophosphoribosyltransferase